MVASLFNVNMENKNMYTQMKCKWNYLWISIIFFVFLRQEYFRIEHTKIHIWINYFLLLLFTIFTKEYLFSSKSTKSQTAHQIKEYYYCIVSIYLLCFCLIFLFLSNFAFVYSLALHPFNFSLLRLLLVKYLIKTRLLPNRHNF